MVPPLPVKQRHSRYEGFGGKVAQVSDDLGWTGSQAGSVRNMFAVLKGETLVSFLESLVRFVDESRI